MTAIDLVVDQARRHAWAIRRGKPCSLEKLGSGVFSRVYDLGPELVLKVGGRSYFGYDVDPRGGNITDDQGVPLMDGWPDYVRHIQRMKKRPSWAPKVYHLEFLGEFVYFAVMEKLCYSGYENAWSDSLRVPRRIVRSACKQYPHLRLDLHDGNIMVRGSTWVINDPWAPRGEDWED